MDSLPTKPNVVSFEAIDLDRLELNEGQLDGLPSNPREIDISKFELLKKNIQDYPQFLQYNMLKVFNLPNTDRFIVIGGNMRLRALRELGFDHAPCAVISPATSIEELKAYVILDNNSFGKYDWAAIANEWDEQQLTSWGVDLPIMESNVNIDDFFDEDTETKEKGEKITISLPLEYKENKDQIIGLVKDALSEYDGVKVK